MVKTQLSAPFSEEENRESNLIETIIVHGHGFQPAAENFDFDKKGYHPNELLNRRRMAQISALWYLPLGSYVV